MKFDFKRITDCENKCKSEKIQSLRSHAEECISNASPTHPACSLAKNSNNCKIMHPLTSYECSSNFNPISTLGFSLFHFQDWIWITYLTSRVFFYHSERMGSGILRKLCFSITELIYCANERQMNKSSAFASSRSQGGIIFYSKDREKNTYSFIENNRRKWELCGGMKLSVVFFALFGEMKGTVLYAILKMEFKRNGTIKACLVRGDSHGQICVR